jgi:acetoin utilization deacetylase AcuC-like enzyme
MAEERKSRAVLVDDPHFGEHRPPAYHPERPERLVAARAALDRAGRDRFTELAPRRATDDELARAHAPRFVEKIAKLEGQSSLLDPDTYVAPGSVRAARLAAGGAIALVDALLDGEERAGVAIVRPPGHHARVAQAMGFCLFNNVAVAAAHARARGVGKVAIVDWDVHHGNGTQEIFYRDPSVLYASLHQYPFYPGTGAADETGEGEGVGYTVNVPLTAGGGDAIYRAAFERVVLPVLERFAPDLVLVSAGFDASARDPLAEMALTPDAFAWMGAELARVARATAGGRVGLLLEGGYDLVALETGLEAAIRGVLDGGAPAIPADRDHADVTRAARTASRVWTGLD